MALPRPPFAALADLSGATTGAPGVDLTRYLLVCGLLILVIGGLGWAFRRFVAGALRAKAARRSLGVIDVLPLGGRQKLAVVRCYDRTFLLGLGDREVSLVAELDHQESEAEAESSPAPGIPASDRDRRAFARELLRMNARAQPAPERASAPHTAAPPRAERREAIRG